MIEKSFHATVPLKSTYINIWLLGPEKTSKIVVTIVEVKLLLYCTV